MEDRQEQRRRRRRGGGCPCCRRGRRAGSCESGPRSRARRPARRRTGTIGHADARPELGALARPPARRVTLVDTGSGKSSASSPKPGIDGGPAPVGRLEARGGRPGGVSPGSAPSTATGPLTWSTPVEVERREVGGRRLGGQLARSRRRGSRTRPTSPDADRRDRRDRRVPGQVESRHGRRGSMVC